MLGLITVPITQYLWSKLLNINSNELNDRVPIREWMIKLCLYFVRVRTLQSADRGLAAAWYRRTVANRHLPGFNWIVETTVAKGAIADGVAIAPKYEASHGWTLFCHQEGMGASCPQWSWESHQRRELLKQYLRKTTYQQLTSPDKIFTMVLQNSSDQSMCTGLGLVPHRSYSDCKSEEHISFVRTDISSVHLQRSPNCRSHPVREVSLLYSVRLVKLSAMPLFLCWRRISFFCSCWITEMTLYPKLVIIINILSLVWSDA